MGIPFFSTSPYLYLLSDPLFLKTFSGNNFPMKNGINTKKTSPEKYNYLSLEDCKLTLHAFFYKQHQAKIWFKIITISGIKVSFKKKNIVKEKLWGKEHYCYKIHTVVIKSRAYPHLFTDNLPIWNTPLQNLKTPLRPSFYDFMISGKLCLSSEQIKGFFDHKFL